MKENERNITVSGSFPCSISMTHAVLYQASYREVIHTA